MITRETTKTVLVSRDALEKLLGIPKGVQVLVASYDEEWNGHELEADDENLLFKWTETETTELKEKE